MSRFFTLGLFAWLIINVSGCSSPESVKEIPYQATASMHNLMTWMIDPTADVLWGSAGFIITEAGEQDLQPTSQAGWDHVRDNATMLAEAGNVLMIPGYRVDDQWVEYASGLVQTSILARQAALAKDADALFDAGGKIYNVCRACHSRYIVESS
ncbi:MAG: hypothetical protein GXP16_02010 [Gammaproteobacteria bacterium]|nr:hypothetical protein [Gammaproteobacteria bacterium]